MGKKQHQKDKLYLTNTEWRTQFGGYKGRSATGEASKFRRLPFSCCSLSFQPFENPLCTKEGVVFDLMNIVPFLKKYGINPVTGEKLSAKELIKLNFHKNGDGKYHCPVTFKIFNENTHIVAVKPTGNVFSLDAVERLNIKPSFFKDLLTDEPFTRKDIITLQDPTNVDKFNLNTFYHVKKNLKYGDEDEDAARKNPMYNLKSVNAETRDVLSELERDYKPAEKKEKEVRKADHLNAAHYSTGQVAASFTSTVMDPTTRHEAAIIDEDVLRYEIVKKNGKKGYVSLITNYGLLNLELHCDMVPKTCENFIKLCKKGYYRDTKFHRLIRNFVIQGGDPTSTGTGGESAWGDAFNDEIKPNLTHTGRGILSMANSGPNTNKSQFFITFRSAKHLDGKHAVFGRCVGGLDTLDKVERIEVDKKDRPKKDIVIEDCRVFVNPYEDADEELALKRDEILQKQEEEVSAKRKYVYKKETEDDAPKAYKKGVGKYINPAALKRSAEDTPPPTVKKKAAVEGAALTDFSSW